jgi:hypothetical protein
MFPECRFQQDGGHPGPNDIPDEFTETVVGKAYKRDSGTYAGRRGWQFSS